MRKKFKLSDIKDDWVQEPCRYYFCINCGNSGDFKKLRTRGIVCDRCGYDQLVPQTEEEHNEELLKRNKVL